MKTPKTPKIPETIFGVPVSEETYNRVVLKAHQKKVKPRQVAPDPIRPIDLSNPQDYILIPDTEVLIAKEQTHNGLNWNETHETLSKEGLFMPSPYLFTKYFTATKDASEGKITLYDGTNSPLPRTEATELWNSVSSTDRQGRGDCWIWLDARFVEGSGHKGLDLETDHRVVSGKLQGQRQPLEAYLTEDSYANLEFNRQGLPIKKAKAQSYEQGENLFFWSPIKDRVAGFGANSDRASLGCGRDPSYSDSGLGVLAAYAAKKS